MKHDGELVTPEPYRSTFRTCDFCSKVIKEREDYEIKEASISCRRGTRYPEGGSSVTKIVDVCADCFDEKVIPVIEGLGVKFREEEHDF